MIFQPIHSPGPWQYYVKRRDNIGLPIMEVRRKYLTEQLQFENFQQQQMMMLMGAAGGGPPITGSSVSPLPRPGNFILAENEDILVTERGDNLILE